jgi:limonene-1,2-epoxide hydrolase
MTTSPIATTAEEGLALDFFADWSKSDPSVLLKYFAPDAVYQNIPTPPLSGTAEIEAFLTEFFAAFTLQIETTATASNGRFVFSERIDYLRGAAGLCELKIVGVMEFEDGLITAWRDYYDSRQAEGFSVEDVS